MFERIGIGTGRCIFCGGWGTVAVLATHEDYRTDAVEADEKCIRAAQKAAELLKTIRMAKSPKAKKAPSKARKSRTSQPSESAGHPDAASTRPSYGLVPEDDLVP